MMRHARLQSKPLLFPDWTIAMHCYIISPYLWQTTYSEWRTVLHVWWHALAKGNIYHQFCSSCTGFLYVSDHCTGSCFVHSKFWMEQHQCIYAIWSKHIYQWKCSNLSPIHFWGYQEAIQQCTERYHSEHQLPDCGNELPNHIKLEANKNIFIYTGVFIILNHLIMYEIYLIYMSWKYVVIAY